MSAWSELTDERVIDAVQRAMPGQGGVAEMQRRLKAAVETLEQTTKALSRRMEFLTWVLITLTVVIAVLTGALVYKEFWGR